MNSDSDEEETFVTIGTALETYTEDEAPKKPFVIQDQAVTDSRGRPRFHGAFTGGFSAGYFNTVGTKEGFTPSLFVSSRNKKHEAQNQNPEDFMDDEDFGEHGIAPKKVSATDDYNAEGRKRKDNKSHISDLSMLKDLVVPHSKTMGFKLLRHLGWKEGQGIGPRVQRQKHKSKGASKKKYGCALPGSVSEESDNEEDGDNDYLPQNVTFAPKDVNPIKFQPKDDLHGLGYSGINHTSIFGTPSSKGHINLFESADNNASTAGFRSKKQLQKAKIGMKGQAFGVGEYEDEDDIDVYSRESMEHYDIEIGGQSSEKNFGWTAPKFKGLSAAPVGYIGKVLEGFKLSTNTLKPKKNFPRPDLPRNFKPFHVRSLNSDQVKPKTTVTSKNMDANLRKNMLGEISSVFDLVSSSDKSRIETAKEMTVIKTEPKEKQDKSKQSENRKGSRFECGESSVSATGTDSNTIPHYKGKLEFKPFSKDTAKQARYEKYLETAKKGKKNGPDDIPDSSMTEWERNKELNEFAMAAHLYKPMSSVMASRFTAAKFDDSEQTVDLPADEVTDKSDQSKAVEMKMFGKLTREKYDWHPDRVLCKRFNVANPYPESTIVGVPKVKRDKYSVFNFLNDPTNDEKAESPIKDTEVEDDTFSGPNISDVNMRPLAILAKDDITLQTTNPSDIGESSNIQMNPLEPNTVQLHEVKERPSIDIFKAIFSESEDESSSSENENEPILQERNPQDKSSTLSSSILGLEKGRNDFTRPMDVGTIPVQTLQERLSPNVDQLSYQRMPNIQSSTVNFNVGHVKTPSTGDVKSVISGENYLYEAVVEPDGAVWTEKTLESEERSKHKHNKHKHKLKKKKVPTATLR